MVNLPEFYRDKRVLVTGHTGFKGGWLIFWLNKLGARVCGYGLEPSELSLYRCIEGAGLCQSQIGDVADFEHLSKVFDDFRPEIVFHLAAQPIGPRGLPRAADDLSHQCHGYGQFIGVRAAARLRSFRRKRHDRQGISK